MQDKCGDCMGTGESFPGVKCQTCKGDGVARRKAEHVYRTRRGGVLRVSREGRCSVIAPRGGPAVAITRKGAADALRNARSRGDLLRPSHPGA